MVLSYSQAGTTTTATAQQRTGTASIKYVVDAETTDAQPQQTSETVEKKKFIQLLFERRSSNLNRVALYSTGI